MKRTTSIFVLVFFLLSIIGCATIVSGRMQNLPVISSPDGAVVTMGNLRQRTPCVLHLDRRMGAYQIKIEKDGYEPVTVTLKKGVNGWVFGNLVFGGIIGLIVDVSSGAASSFRPSKVEIELVRKRLGLESHSQDILIVKLKNE